MAGFVEQPDGNWIPGDEAAVATSQPEDGGSTPDVV
jgi:hypothetical protein